ncbi:MAG: hypothetical protein MR451_05955, partial [Clostridiales bacterium]|nr:hypothetical protein [Clostridiales bacterium]
MQPRLEQIANDFFTRTMTVDLRAYCAEMRVSDAELQDFSTPWRLLCEDKELTAKPLRLFRNQHYQKFCRLVESLSPFESLPSAAVAWSNALSESLTALRIAVEAQGDETAIRTTLIRLQAIPDLPGDMSKRLHALTAVQKRPDLLAFCRTPDYLKEIDAVVSEMQYQLLCDQVEQIHARIAAQVP